jgi:hypothetical protein
MARFRYDLSRLSVCITSIIASQGFRPGGIMSVAPGQVFSSPSAMVLHQGMEDQLGMVTPTNALSIPSANLSTGTIGSEVKTNQWILKIF